MIISLHKGERNKIYFELEEGLLLEAVKSCNLGSGTIYDPIKADSFIRIRDLDLTVFYEGETIELELGLDTSLSEKFKLNCCILKNVGKEFNNAGETALNFWKSVFQMNNNPLIQSLPNGSLVVTPENKVASLKIQHELTSGPDPMISYISYSILFERAINGVPCYFMFDPLLRISSNPPPPIE